MKFEAFPFSLIQKSHRHLIHFISYCVTCFIFHNFPLEISLQFDLILKNLENTYVKIKYHAAEMYVPCKTVWTSLILLISPDRFQFVLSFIPRVFSQISSQLYSSQSVLSPLRLDYSVFFSPFGSECRKDGIPFDYLTECLNVNPFFTSIQPSESSIRVDLSIATSYSLSSTIPTLRDISFCFGLTLPV